MREIHSLDDFDAHLADVHHLDGVVVQGVDLADRARELRSHSCVGATFLGCGLRRELLEHVVEHGAAVFPRLPAIPFDPYRPRLYGQGELLTGWVPGGDFHADALDSLIYAWSEASPHGRPPAVLDALAQRLHDHAIDDALRDHLTQHPDVVALMGGHALGRSEPGYRTVAELGRGMAREGWHLATGGGPGAMEAANLGAWLAPHADDAIDAAIAELATAPDYRDADAYLTAGVRVLERWPEGGESLAVPTWFYGHEPTNQFATCVAKYFANSIREDGLLAIANRGVVFAPGAAGTTQEVFQDATQNHYAVFGNASAMVFLDRQFWTERLPAEPLLRTLAADRPYASLIGVADTADEALVFLRDHPPIEVHAR